PVEADAHVRVARVVDALQGLTQDVLCAREVAHVAQDVAKERRVPRFRGRVAARGAFLDAALEERDGLLRAAGLRVRTAEVGVEIDASGGIERLVLDGRFEERGAARVLTLVLQKEREREAGTRRGGVVAVGDGLGDRLLEGAFEVVGLAQADRELEVGEPELTRGARVDVRAGLEVVGGDVELGGEPPERLDGRLPAPGFDPGDVRVRDAGGSELTLGETPLLPQALEPLPDRLARGWRRVG